MHSNAVHFVFLETNHKSTKRKQATDSLDQVSRQAMYI